MLITQNYCWQNDKNAHPYLLVQVSPSDLHLLGLSLYCSTVSSGLNSLAAVTLFDVVKVIRPQTTDKQGTLIAKGLALVYGVISIALASSAVELGSGILSVSRSTLFKGATSQSVHFCEAQEQIKTRCSPCHHLHWVFGLRTPNSL